MEFQGKRVLVCDCEHSMPLGEARLERACRAAGGSGAVEIATQLCRAQLPRFTQALAGPGPLLVACTQESPIFEETRAEAAPQAEVGYVNIRERAGWSGEADQAMPKIAALLAEAALDIPAAGALTLTSEGACLVYGAGEVAIELAEKLAGRLDVTVLLTGAAPVIPPALARVPVFRGRIVKASGHLGAFEIGVDGYAPAIPSSRADLRWEPPRDGAFSKCDIIIDLSGGAPLFPAHEKRDGYLRADPGDRAAVLGAGFEAIELVGEFEKPAYVAYDAALCAHSRSRKTGCTRCLDVCPTGAIRPDGDHVAIDAFVCAGCGSCGAVCPTGAATYQMPPGDAIHRRLKTLLGAYRAAGGEQAVLLIHDRSHGDAMIGMMARFGRGLPARVLPFAVTSVTQTGLDHLAAALSHGAAQVRVLVGPKQRGELMGLAQQIGLAEALLTGLGWESGRVGILDESDPEALEAALWALPRLDPPRPGSFLPMGGKRAITWLGLRHLQAVAPAPVPLLPLPPGAPFGTVKVDVDGCTLCLACVGACPTGALLDDPDRPRLSFVEDACVQCGLCKATCPEKVITLAPRLNFEEAARSPQTVKEEQPYHCIRCGKPFGARGSIERIIDKLSGKHPMFRTGAQAERIRMCEDCRVIVQFEAGQMAGSADPFAGPPRPAIRTTDDDLREREIEEARARLRRERGELPEA